MSVAVLIEEGCDVDDMKLSHKDPMVVKSMIKYLKNKYEQLPNGEIKKMEIQIENWINSECNLI